MTLATLEAGPAESPPPAFDEALRWFRGRVPMTDAAFAALTAEAQRRAFTLAGAAALTVVSDVWRSLDATLAAGRTLRDFKRDVAPALLDQWQGSVANPAWRMEVIFRNATQRAYVHGRVEQLRDPEVARVRPVWMFDAVGDARTSAICSALDGTALAADDPWWQAHTPPCHHACRSTIRGLRASDPRAKAATGAPPMVAAQAGFGVLPEADDWRPRQADYPAEAWAAYQGNPQAYRAPAPRAPTREMPVFVPPTPAPKPKTPTMEAPAFTPPKPKTPTVPMPVFTPPKAAPPPTPAPKTAKTPKPKAAPKAKAPTRGPVIPSPPLRDGPSIRSMAAPPSNAKWTVFGDIDSNPDIEGSPFFLHDNAHYPENHVNPEYAATVRAVSRPIYDALPEAQRNAIYAYTGPEYAKINALLRDRDRFRAEHGAAETKRVEKLARDASAALSALPRVQGDMVLFRGLSLPKNHPLINELGTADELTFPAFGSFSRSIRTARDFATKEQVSVIYRLKRHTSGVPLDGVSSIPSETEVLFRPGTRFRVIGRQKVRSDRIVVDLEEITDD